MVGEIASGFRKAVVPENSKGLAHFLAVFRIFQSAQTAKGVAAEREGVVPHKLQPKEAEKLLPCLAGRLRRSHPSKIQQIKPPIFPFVHFDVGRAIENHRFYILWKCQKKVQ